MLFYGQLLLDKLYSFAQRNSVEVSEIQNYCVLIVLFTILYKVFTNVHWINVVKTSYPRNDIVQFHHVDENGQNNSCTLQEFINENVKEFSNGSWSIFNPLLSNGHLQTMWAGIRQFRFSDKVYFTRKLFRVSDGALVGLDRVVPVAQFNSVPFDKQRFTDGQPQKIDSFTRYMSEEELEKLETGSDDTRPIFIILPGLSGSSSESYVRSFFYELLNYYNLKLDSDSNFDCYCLNTRGSGNVNITTPQLFCGLWTQDIREVIQFFKLKYPNRKIYCMGVSIGSIILNNYLCQEGENSGVTLAFLVASVWDLSTSSYALENNFISSLFYSTALAFPLLKVLDRHKNKLREDPSFVKSYTPETCKKIVKLKIFDDYFTSQFFGFTCANHYYAEGSPLNRIINLRTPVVNISSLDDPVTNGVEPHIIDRASFQPFINMVNVTLGGHVGFFTFTNRRWHCRPAAELVTKFHNKMASQPAFEMKWDETLLPQPPLHNDRLPVKIT
ncbi:putative carboxylic ester hydrolase [Martiniozyma asiatica (nom. inval.)]|nr:putative carboxylic ester hydrolase [Martiniozyma asiatica]